MIIQHRINKQTQKPRNKSASKQKEQTVHSVSKKWERESESDRERERDGDSNMMRFRKCTPFSAITFSQLQFGKRPGMSKRQPISKHRMQHMDQSKHFAAQTSPPFITLQYREREQEERGGGERDAGKEKRRSAHSERRAHGRKKKK